MRIGILTLPLHTNYGGILQAYALQTVLKRMGHDATLIDRPFDKLTIIGYIKLYIYKALTFIPFQKRFVKFWSVPPNITKAVRKETDYFIDKYLDLTEKFYSNNIKEIHKHNFEAYVVGSDQVWRRAYCPSLSDFYLGFAKNDNVKKVAYAASFGIDYWDYTDKETELCSSLLKNFDAVSVRESSAIGLCKSQLGCSAIHVLDPTLLLSASDYEYLAKQEQEPKSEGNLFCYILDKDSKKQSLINKVSADCGLTSFEVMPKLKLTEDNAKKHLNDCVFPSVTKWLRAFMDAEMVITDSFHGCVFSIIFNKPFWVVGNNERGQARFSSLLSLFKLEDRLISVDDIESINWNTPIDWDSINNTKKEWQDLSLSFLTENLK